RAPQREIAEPNFFHEPQSLLNFRNKAGSNRLVRSPKLQFLDFACCFASRKTCELIDRVTLDTHMACHSVQSRAVTTRTFARFAFFDPFGFALGGELGFQDRFTVGAGGGLQILVPNFAESAAFFARTVR